MGQTRSEKPALSLRGDVGVTDLCSFSIALITGNWLRSSCCGATSSTITESIRARQPLNWRPTGEDGSATKSTSRLPSIIDRQIRFVLLARWRKEDYRKCRTDCNPKWNMSKLFRVARASIAQLQPLLQTYLHAMNMLRKRKSLVLDAAEN